MSIFCNSSKIMKLVAFVLIIDRACNQHKRMQWRVFHENIKALGNFYIMICVHFVKGFDCRSHLWTTVVHDSYNTAQFKLDSCIHVLVNYLRNFSRNLRVAYEHRFWIVKFDPPKWVTHLWHATLITSNICLYYIMHCIECEQ